MDYCVTHVAGQERLGGSRVGLMGRHRRTLWMCDGKLRLQKGRSMMVSDKLFLAHYKEFEQLVEAKVIRVQVEGPSGSDYLFSKEDSIAPEFPPPEAAAAPAPPPPPEESEEEPVVEDPAEEKPLDKMNKAELVSFLAEKSGLPEEELNSYTKRQLLEQAPELLAESGEAS